MVILDRKELRTLLGQLSRTEDLLFSLHHFKGVGLPMATGDTKGPNA